MSKFFYEGSNSLNKWSIDFEYDDRSISVNLNTDCEDRDILFAIKNGLIVSNGYTINITVNGELYMLNPKEWIWQLSGYVERDTVDDIVKGLCESIHKYLNKPGTALKPLMFSKNDSLFTIHTTLSFEKEEICKAKFTVERVVENSLIHNFKKTDEFVWYSSCSKNLYDFLRYNLIVNYNFSLQETSTLVDQFEALLKNEVNSKGVVRLRIDTDLCNQLQFTFPTDLFRLFCDSKEKSTELFLKYYKGILMKVVCRNGEEYEVSNTYYDLEKFFYEILNINHNFHWRAVCQSLDDYRRDFVKNE